MDKMRTIVGTAVPLQRSDVDTDQIIPTKWCRRLDRTGLADGLFGEWRKTEPDFVFNQPQFSGASILVAGPRFGVGSSREHAVWALQDYGIRAVVSPKFGDIFRSNSVKMGLVPVEADGDFVEALQAAVLSDPTAVVSVDVEALEVRAEEAGLSASFPLDKSTRWRLLEGLDDIGVSLRFADAIGDYEKGRGTWLPTTTAR